MPPFAIAYTICTFAAGFLIWIEPDENRCPFALLDIFACLVLGLLWPLLVVSALALAVIAKLQAMFAAPEGEEEAT